MFKPSGNPKVIELTKSIKERSYNLSCLHPIKLEELNIKGKPKRLCAWCAVGELLHGNQKYCSNLCSDSAMAWSYPQKENSLKFLLIKQEWKCADCQFDYSPIMKTILRREKERYPTSPGEDRDLNTLEWYYFKRLKGKCIKERAPEIDHILAICNGGESLGISNHQVLCYTCHKNKTKKDLSGKKKKTLDTFNSS